MKPRLLFLAQTLPYPPTGGVKIRTYHTLRLLSSAFDVTALCFYRWKKGRLEPDVADAVEQLSRLARVEAFPIPSDHSRLRLIWDHVRSLAARSVYTNFTYQSREFRAAIERELQSDHYDLVHADSLDLSRYFDLIPNGELLVCVHHDAQSLLLQRRAEREQSRLLASYLRIQSRFMRGEEARTCSSVSLNVAVSEADAEVLRSRTPEGSFAVLPNGVDTDFFAPEFGEENGVCFVGGTTWFPNRDALEHYTVDILPEIRRRLPDLETTWIGRASEEEKARYADTAGISLTGFVPDIRPYLARSAGVVVPLRVGGGTRIKILDAWAMGKAVVSTSLGCEGLKAIDGQNIMIADGPIGFARAVEAIATDEGLRRRLGANARRTAVEDYSWDVIGAEMIQLYRALIASDSELAP